MSSIFPLFKLSKHPCRYIHACLLILLKTAFPINLTAFSPYFDFALKSTIIFLLRIFFSDMLSKTYCRHSEWLFLHVVTSHCECVFRLWRVWSGKCLWGRRVCEHRRLVQLFLQSSVGSGQHAAALHQPQHYRRCDDIFQSQRDRFSIFYLLIVITLVKPQQRPHQPLESLLFSNELLCLLLVITAPSKYADWSPFR